MPTISAPPCPDLTAGKLSGLRYWFIQGSLGEHTYYASLIILRMTPEEARAEVQSALEERKRTCKTQ